MNYRTLTVVVKIMLMIKMKPSRKGILTESKIEDEIEDFILENVTCDINGLVTMITWMMST